MLAIGKRVQSGPGEVLILDVTDDYTGLKVNTITTWMT